MKASFARAVVAGALVLAVAPLATPSQALFTCGDLEEVCSTACNVTTATRKVCGLFA